MLLVHETDLLTLPDWVLCDQSCDDIILLSGQSNELSESFPGLRVDARCDRQVSRRILLEERVRRRS